MNSQHIITNNGDLDTNNEYNISIVNETDEIHFFGDITQEC